MKLTGFELIDSGRRGVVISYDEQKKGDKFSALDSVKRTCRIPIPMTLRAEVIKLKHYFLTATGYWKPSWTKLLRADLLSIDDDKIVPVDIAEEKAKAHDLLLNTVINGVKVKNKGIFISGTVTINDKCITPKYDFVAPDDEYGIYDEIYERMEIISEIIFEYMSMEELKLADVKQILSEMVKTEDDKQRVKTLSDHESLEEMISLLEERGCIIIEPDGGIESEEPAPKNAKIEKEPELTPEEAPEDEEVPTSEEVW